MPWMSRLRLILVIALASTLLISGCDDSSSSPRAEGGGGNGSSWDGPLPGDPAYYPARVCPSVESAEAIAGDQLELTLRSEYGDDKGSLALGCMYAREADVRAGGPLDFVLGVSEELSDSLEEQYEFTLEDREGLEGEGTSWGLRTPPADIGGGSYELWSDDEEMMRQVAENAGIPAEVANDEEGTLCYLYIVGAPNDNVYRVLARTSEADVDDGCGKAEDFARLLLEP